MKLINLMVPEATALAGMHDHFLVQLPSGFLRDWVINVPGMGVAGAITYPALMRGLPSVWLSQEP